MKINKHIKYWAILFVLLILYSAGTLIYQENERLKAQNEILHSYQE